MLLSCGAGKNSWESCERQGNQTSQMKSTLNTLWKDWCWSSNPLDTWWEELVHWRNPNAGKDKRQKEKRATEDEMVGWHHWFSGPELGQAPGDSERQGSWLSVGLRGVGHNLATELQLCHWWSIQSPTPLPFQEVKGWDRKFQPYSQNVGSPGNQLHP